VVQLNQDGSLDAGFNPPFAGSDLAAEQPDGRIVIYSGSSLLRLNVDGTLDPNFAPVFPTDLGGGGCGVRAGWALAATASGDILYAGRFSEVDGFRFIPRARVGCRADADVHTE